MEAVGVELVELVEEASVELVEEVSVELVEEVSVEQEELGFPVHAEQRGRLSRLYLVRRR